MLTQRAAALALAFLHAVPAFAQTGKGIPDHYAAITDQRVHSIARQASEELNQRLPMTVNSQTRADTSVVGPGRRFTYLFTDISDQSKTVTAAQINREIGLSVRNKVCTTDALKLLVDNDYLITYKYFDTDGRFIGDIIVKQRDCTSLIQ
jgi:hypothetical protein